MSTTVWAVTSGSYSDYRVKALFPTEELANLAIANAPPYWNGYDVEAFELFDELPANIAIYERMATIWDDGEVLNHDHVPILRVEAAWDLTYPDRAVPVRWRWVRAPVHEQRDGGRLLVFGIDEERVMRVFSDKRAEILATPSLAMQKEARG